MSVWGVSGSSCAPAWLIEYCPLARGIVIPRLGEASVVALTRTPHRRELIAAGVGERAQPIIPMRKGHLLHLVARQIGLQVLRDDAVHRLVCGAIDWISPDQPDPVLQRESMTSFGHSDTNSA